MSDFIQEQDFIQEPEFKYEQESELYDSIMIDEKYKTYRGFKYHLNFPNGWIINEEPFTGRECNNCVGNDNSPGFAMWRGIILGYCANCAFHYNGNRGRGFYAHAVEFIRPNNVGDSVFDTYLKDIDLENTGDINDNPEDTIENHLMMKENIYEICDEYYKFVEEMEESQEQEYSDF
jgi:hypothetical protein